MALFVPDPTYSAAITQAARQRRKIGLMSAQTVPPPLSFVTRDSDTGSLMVDGLRFRFSGGNAAQDIGLVDATNGNFYGGTVHSGYYLTPQFQIDAYLNTAQAMNATVIRLFGAVTTTNHVDAVEPTLGVFNSAALQVVDYAIQQCAIRGIRLLIPLSNEYGSKLWYVSATTGGGAVDFHTAPTTIAAFKAHISYVLNHVNVYTGIVYKNDPAIFAWETGNELTQNGLTNAQYAVWTDTISRHIKITEGAQQLVMDGKYGTTGDWVNYDYDALALPYVDVYSNHAYDNYRSPVNMQLEAQAAHTFGKAFVMGEWSWTDRTTSGVVNSWGLADMITQVNNSPHIDGDVVWDFLAPGTIWYDGFSLHRPADGTCRIPNPYFPYTPFFMSISDEDNRGTQLSNHATVMSGVAPAMPAKAQTLVDTFGSFDAAKWDVLGAAPTVTGGRLSIATPTSTEQAFSSDLKYDLTNSSIVVELVTKNPGTGSSACGMYVQAIQAPYGLNLIGFVVDGTTVRYRYRAAGSDSDTTETYSSINHRWLRLRADPHTGVGGGTVYWDTSDNGINWLTKRIFSAPIHLLNSLNLILFNWNYGSDVTSGTVLFDNFNSPPSAVPTLYPPVKRPNRGALVQL